MPDMHNVFISHRHEDDARVLDLKLLLSNRDVRIRDSSITTETPNNAHNEEYIKTQILAPNINWAGKVIVLITPDTKNHPWIDWEVEYAERQGKPIIGVWAPGSAGCEVPEALERHADAIVSWNVEKIISALEGQQIWERPDGGVRAPQTISTIGC